MKKHFKLTKETKTLPDGTILHRIQALVDLPKLGVKKGDLGGFIEKESNLNDSDWAYSDAMLYGDPVKFYDIYKSLIKVLIKRFKTL